MAVPNSPHYRGALSCGNTLRVRSCVHWVHGPVSWLERERLGGATVLGVELAEDATWLGDLKAATKKTIVLLGHERNGIPDYAWPLLDQVVEIPMVGVGASLNVAVAGSLVLYKLAGLS
jgi:tRNA (guanosine-2'-O-)-methyltransferase